MWSKLAVILLLLLFSFSVADENVVIVDDMQQQQQQEGQETKDIPVNTTATIAVDSANNISSSIAGNNNNSTENAAPNISNDANATSADAGVDGTVTILKDEEEAEKQQQQQQQVCHMTAGNEPKCEGSPSDSKIRTDVFIAIISAQGRESMRHALRETWVKELSNLKVSYKFFLGGSTRPLDLDKGDVVQLPVDDTFDAFIQKTFAVFGWIVKHVQTQLVFKTNDNVMVAPYRMLPRIRNLERRGVYHGCRYADDKPVRTKGDKYELKSEDYPWDALIPYVEGTGITLSYDLVEFLAHNMQYSYRSARVEDIAIAHWLSALQVYPQHDSTFIPGWSDEMTRQHCRKDFTILPHLRCPRVINTIWQAMTAGIDICTLEELPGAKNSC